jgi:molybdenum cofactor biosynthesis enzyme MoaA
VNLDNFFLDAAEYNLIRKSDWPTYSELLSGKPIQHAEIKTQIDQYIELRQKKYWAIHKGDTIADGNRSHQNQVFYNKKVNVSTGQYCTRPWETLGVNSYGDIFICASPAWIPKFVGNILQAADIYQDVLNSDAAQKIRQEIIAGRYYYCNNKICGYFNSQLTDAQFSQQPQELSDLEELPYEQSELTCVTKIPKNLIFDFDHTCNFVCPSCRTGLINNNKHSVISSVNRNIAEKIKTLIIDKIGNQPVNIRWAGGEPFISKVYLDLLQYTVSKNKSNITHTIQTNGSYLKAKQDLVESLLPYVSEMRISFDAATAETYRKTRVNGVWDTLIDNATWLVELQKKTGYPKKITADFVVQADNYHEIYQFYELCNSIGIKYINYQRMWNWNTWPAETFNQNNVYVPEHPLYHSVEQLLNQVKLAQNENTTR